MKRRENKSSGRNSRARDERAGRRTVDEAPPTNPAGTRERLREYERVVEGLEEMIAVVDRDYRYLLANQAFLNHRNMSRDQVVGHFVWEVLSPALFDEIVKPKLDQVFAGEVVKYEMQRDYPGLGRRDLLISYFPIEGESGVDRIACVLQDVTTRKQTEKALRQSEHQMAEAQRLAHIGSWNWDLQADTRSWSEELYRIFGMDPDEPPATFETAMAKMVHPDDRDSFVNAVETSLATGQPCDVSYRIIRPDGAERIIHSRGTVILDETGKASRMFGTAQDVTARRRTENALREAEKHYRDIFENAEEGIFQSTPDGRFIAANPALARIHGFDSPEELIRERTDISRDVYADPERREEFKRLLEANGSVLGFEFELSRRDGHKIVVSVNARAVFDEQGAIRYYEGTALDISDRKRAEKALLDSEQRFRALIEHGHDAIALFDAEGAVLYASPSTTTIMGYSPEELAQRNALEFVRPDWVDVVREELSESLRCPGVGIPTQAYVRHKDGEYRFLEGVFTNLLDEPSVGAIVNNYRDNTERKKAEIRSAAFASLARKLSGSSTQLEAGKIIAETARELFGWDACNLDLYDGARNEVRSMLNLDTIDGRLVDVTPTIQNRAPTGRSRRIIEQGPELILRTEPVTFDRDAVPFGDTTRPSASIMAVPVLHAAKVIGLLTIQSYRPNAYDQSSLAHLEALADHCGEALNRIHIEQSLRESEERFRQMAEHFEDVIWIADRKLEHVFYINPAYERIFGRSCGSLLERFDSFLESVHPEDRKSVERRLERQRHGDVGRLEYRIIRPDGQVRWILRRSFPIKDKDGNIHCVAGIGQDVTERKHAEVQLRESEERYRDLVEHSRELICTHDLEGLILSANQAAATALGYDLELFVGKRTIRDILSPRFQDQFDLYMSRLQEKGGTSGLMVVQTSSGEERIWEYYNSLRTEGVARPIVRGMARDVTEQRQAAKALRESEEQYRELFENSRDAIYVHDLHGTYVSVNRAAEELSGFTREEIIGRHYSNFIGPRNLKDARENFCRKLDLPIETTYEAEVVCKNGTRKPVEVSSRMIYKDEIAIGVQGTVRDISERKRAQQALHTYSRRLLEAQETERQNIARELHDEIGQILTAVSLNLHSIQKTSQTEASRPNIEESLQIVEDALSRVRELSLELRPSLLDDLGLAAALRWYVGRYTARSGIVTEIIGDAQLGRISHDVETACFRIIQEALTNTARHSRATRASVNIQRTNGNLHLTVTDNGIGFESDQILYGMASALALGLRGMQERALAVKGQVQITSTPGHGTKVTLNVPVTK